MGVIPSDTGDNIFSLEPPVEGFFLEDAWDPEVAMENFESKDVFSVDAPGPGPGVLSVLDVGLEYEGAVTTSTTPSLSKDMMLGRLLNWARCMTVGSSWPLRYVTDSPRSPNADELAEEVFGGSTQETVDIAKRTSMNAIDEMFPSKKYYTYCCL